MKSSTYGIIYVFLTIVVSVYGQQNNLSNDSNNFFGKFGYEISLLNLNKYDSNVLKYSNGASDFSSAIYPAVEIAYQLSANTKLTAQYLLGLEKYASTSFLNTNNNRLSLHITQYVSPRMSLMVSGYYQNSQQPDLLSTRLSAYKFASFDQYSISLKLNWLASSKTLYSFEYHYIKRSYTGMLTLFLEKQKDSFNFSALGWTHQFSQTTTASAKLGFINSASNNRFYNFKRQFIDLFLTHQLGDGFRAEAGETISTLRFSSRTLTNDPSTTRSDIISTLMIGVKKVFNEYIAADLRYYFQKDFSNEPLRNFNSHSFNLGFEFALGRNVYSNTNRYSNETDLENNSGINKQSATIEQLTNAGYQYLLKSDYEKSLEFSLKALAINNNIEQAHINAGIAFYKLGKKNLATEQWKTALELNPHNEKLRLLIEKLESEINQAKN